MALFAGYNPSLLNDASVPPFPGQEADEEEDEARKDNCELDYESPVHSWQPVSPGEPTIDAPIRFIDGSIQSKTVGCLIVGSRRRPLIAATISAAALEVDGSALRRSAGARTGKLLCLYSTGIDPDDLRQAFGSLEAMGVQLLYREAGQSWVDFDSLRRGTRGIAMKAMEGAEREVLAAEINKPSLVDGLLERRLVGLQQDVPVVGLVKRQMTSYLPPELQEIAYSLMPGERTPAFILHTEHVDLVNVYLRLSAEAHSSPSYGIVRVTVPLAYVERAHREDLSAYLSGLAAYLYRLRHRDFAYARAGISIEPIVRVEDHLHAILPDLEALVPKLHRLLRAPEKEE